MHRAAIYVRVSTDSDAQRDSPANQIATCLEYAQSIGLESSDALVYNDAGLSGTQLANRPEVSRLLADARAGRFEAVLFTAISRFSRDLSDAFSTKKRLETVYGIRLVSIEEGYDSAVEGRNSEMVFTVHAMLAAHKSREMSKAIRRGLRQSARRGRHTGSIAPFGYVKTDDRTLLPDPDSAPVVRDIFSMYLTGLGVKAIADALNARGIPTPSARRRTPAARWQASTVHAILQNRAYEGTIVAHKRTMTQDLERSRRIDRTVNRLQLRAKDEWVVVPEAHEPVVDPAVFAQVQRLLARKTQHRGMRRGTNLLAGLLVCASCGGAMIVTGGTKPSTDRAYHYVVCARVRRVGKTACDNHTRTRYSDLIRAVLEHLRDSVLLNADSGPDLTRAIEEGRQVQVTKAAQRRDALNAQLYATEQAQKRNLEAFCSGLFPTTLIEERQRVLTARAELLQHELLRLKEEERSRQAWCDVGDDAGDPSDIFAPSGLYDQITQRLIVQTLIECVVIDKSAGVAVYLAWSD